MYITSEYNNKTFEICPYCDTEVEIDAHSLSECPICEKIMLPCSMCDDDDYKKCDWTEEHRCFKFPL